MPSLSRWSSCWVIGHGRKASPCRTRKVRTLDVWRYTEALAALRQVVAKAAADDTSEAWSPLLGISAAGRGRGVADGDPDLR